MKNLSSGFPKVNPISGIETLFSKDELENNSADFRLQLVPLVREILLPTGYQLILGKEASFGKPISGKLLTSILSVGRPQQSGYTKGFEKRSSWDVCGESWIEVTVVFWRPQCVYSNESGGSSVCNDLHFTFFPFVIVSWEWANLYTSFCCLYVHLLGKVLSRLDCHASWGFDSQNGR